MRSKIKIVVKFIVLAVCALSAFCSDAVYAALPSCTCDKPVASNIITNCTIDGTNNGYCEGSDGEGIFYILNLILDILLIGIGILAVIGIVITGIQYLTASGDEEKTRKAKRRMLEIVIGLAIYVILYGLLNWLGVGIDNSNNNNSNGGGSNPAQTTLQTGPENPTSGKQTPAKKQGLPPSGNEGWNQ